MALVPFLVSPQPPRQKQVTTEGIPWPQTPGDKGALPSEAHFKSPSWHETPRDPSQRRGQRPRHMAVMAANPQCPTRQSQRPRYNDFYGLHAVGLKSGEKGATLGWAVGGIIEFPRPPTPYPPSGGKCARACARGKPTASSAVFPRQSPWGTASPGMAG